MNPDCIVIREHISEDDCLHLRHFHPVRRNAVKQFLFKRSEEAFHPCIIKAVVYSAKALNKTVLLDRFPEVVTCILASPV